MVDLFAASSLDSSILTSVLVGVLVMWALEETLGWNFTGLVVPGYLASVFVLQPVTGAVMGVESVLTFGLYVAMTEGLPRWWPWTPPFGRDRFFALLLASVAVRLLVEGVLLEEAAAFGFAVSPDLHSMGLVIVPLTANAIWRTGLQASLVRLTVPVAITWFLLRFVLLAHTNLSLATFELTYEDLALDFVSSPRAYILLLCGAWVGSLANLRWGWDYGGIIVPGLLALCWLEPSRIAATLGESVAIAIGYTLTLKLPWFRTANLTGGRPLVLAFGLAYLARFALSWAVVTFWPALPLRDLLGFGYLLPTLLALKIVKAKEPFRTLVPAVLTSAAGFSLGTAVGFVLAVVSPAPIPPGLDPEAPGGGQSDLLARAWSDEGPVPQIGLLLASPTGGRLHGGDGFGVVERTPHGVSLAVSTRTGPLALAPAGLAVAESLGASAIQICARPGRACDEARTALSGQYPVVVVEAGDRTVLRASGGLPDALRLDQLERLVGPMAIEPSGDGRLVLTLTPAAALRAAALGLGRPVVEATDEDRRVPPGFVGAAVGSTDHRRLREEVLRPLAWWRDGQAGSEDALILASGVAAELGARVVRDGDTVRLVGPDFSVHLGRGGARNRIVTVPFAGDEPGAVVVAGLLHEALGATAVVLETPPLDAHTPYDATRPGTHCVLGLLVDLDAPQVVSIREVDEGNDPGADFTIGTGRPTWSDPRSEAWSEVIRDVLAPYGTVAGLEGLHRELPLADRVNPQRDATEAANGSFVTVILRAAVARRVHP